MVQAMSDFKANAKVNTEEEDVEKFSFGADTDTNANL